MKFKKDCLHCELSSFALKHPLLETKNFRIVCDGHPLTEGHILIISKAHVSCVGALSEKLFREFEELSQKVWALLARQYGDPAAFEHGVIGQTVFHSHVHFLPFNGSVKEIVPEKGVLRSLKSLSELRDIFKKDGKYLFLALEDKLWSVDVSIGVPKFFRERFAKVLGALKRGDWRKMKEDPQLMEEAEEEIKRLKDRWRMG